MALFCSTGVYAQCVSLTTLGSPSMQNFDTLSNTVGSTTNALTIQGWFMTESGGGARDNEQYAVDTGNSNTGDTFSYGVPATPSFNVTNATNASPIVVTTAANTFIHGQDVTISGVNGNTAANGTWTITRISGTQFSLNGSTGNGAYTSGGTAVSAGATERALGQLRSGTLVPLFGSCYTNNTGSTITSLDVAYVGEQWRIGNTAAARDDRMDFQYSLNATDLVTGTWTDVDALDFTNPIKTAAAAGALYGNASVNRVILSNTIGALSIPNGATIWIRWNDIDSSGADDGLAVDDFAITPQGAPPLPTLTINDVSQVETNAGTTTFAFTVSLNTSTHGGVTFDIATADGTAQDDNPAVTEDNDYVAQSLTGQTIPNGSNTYTFNVTVNGDVAIESNETFFVNVTNVTGATVTDGQGQGTINNDDSATLNIDDVAQIETESGTTSFVFTVSLTQPAGGGGVTFEVATANGPAPTATAGTDYVAIPAATPGTITAGNSSTTVTVTVNGDTDFEPSENFVVNITNIAGATPGDTQGQGTIVTDDIGLNINDVTQNELNSGTSVFTFTVSLTSPAEGAGVTFDIATADGAVNPANAGSDYVAKTETGRTIAPGATSATFTVTVNGDATIEPNETFFVNVTNVSGAEVTDNQGLGTITNDDFPSFTIADAAIVEGNAGTQLLTFTVTLTPAAAGPVSVDYATADDSAIAGSGDYVGITTTTLPFNTGETTKTFDVTINGDLTPEGNENFFVNLTNPQGGAAITDSQAFGIIVMDDPRSISAVDTPFTENFDALTSQPSGTTPGATTPVGWTFVEAGSSANALYAADDGGSNSGNTYSYGADTSSERAFGGIQSGSITVQPTIGAFFRNDTGTTINRLTINYFGEEWRLGTAGRQDRLDFQYSTDATSLTTGTWTDFDSLDFLTPNTVSGGQKDGNNPTNRAQIQATITGLSIPNGSPFWIRYNDFNASGADDGLAVDDFSVIANITGGISIDDVSIVEGNSGTQVLTFTVTRSDPAPVGGTTVNYTTANNTALDTDNDYVPTSGTATIPQGLTSTTIDVTINGDTNQEPTETFFVNLSGPVNGTLLDTQGIGTILADDFTFTLISAVQGSGNQSPIPGSTVTVGGIVTGIKQGGSGGFFVQEEVADYDSDPNTSEGIFVFTAGAVPPGVVIGNRVAVTGTVSEFPSSANPHTVTELTSASVSLLAAAQPLPPAEPISTADGAATTNLSQYERFEGMRVAVTLEVTAPTGGNKDETNATGSSDGVFYGVVQGNPRAFREPGIPVMDVVPSEASCAACIPRFDRNPERIRVSSTSQPGATQLNVAVGQIVSNLVGPLDYGFFEYSILPEAATVPIVSGSSTFVAVPTPLASELTVGSINLERFYDNLDDPSNDDAVITATAYNNRLNKASLAIRNVLKTPDVLGIVEMESLPVLQALAAKINADSGGAVNYVAYLEEGNDVGGIDVGFLVNANRVTVNSVTQLGKTATFIDPGDSSVDTLHDRPPLVLDATILRTDATPYNFIVIVNHLRSLNGNEEDSATGLRVREKRRLQAEYVANYIQTRQTTNPYERIITVGDFNAFQFNDGLVDTINTIKGTPPPANQVVEPSSDLVNPDLINLVDTITAGERYSYEFGGNLQVLDHAILNPFFNSTNTRAAFGHFDAGFPEIFRTDATRPERVSDHDGIVTYFDLSPAGALAFSAANYDVAESTTTFNVTVNRTGGSAGAVSATYTVAAGTATAGADFTAATGTISFLNGETSKTFPVTIANDAIDEANQTISLSLSSPLGGATLGAQSTATITILDDDAPPVFTISDVSFAEGNSGVTNAQLTVTLTGASELTSTVNWATADGTATAAGSDYSTSAATLTFNGPGSQTIDIPILGDATDENNETVLVNLSAETNATIGDAQGVVTIVDDDGAPTIIINDLSFNEGNSGTTQYSLTVTLVGSTSQSVSVSWTLDAGTATCCGNDFSGPDGTLTFPVGVTTRTISATIFGDTTFEADETVLVNLYNPVNATISDNQGVFTILNDDTPPVFTITDISYAEGNSGTTNAQITVTKSGNTVFPSTVDYSTANGTATAGSDYTAATGTLTFASFETTQTITIPLLGDTTIEPNETILVNLTNPTTASIGDPQGVLTITNDDGVATLGINDMSITEGDAGSANLTFTVTLTGNTSQTVTVDFATANNTATAGSDYTATSGQLTFAPGTTTQQINVPILGDVALEPTETFVVNLTNAVNATISDNQATGTIVDNDGFGVADLVVTVTQNPTPARGGEPVTITIQVTNNGPASATNVVVSDQFDAGLTLLSANASQGTCTSGNPVTCSLGTLLSGGSATVTIQLLVPAAGGSFNNVVSATSAESDPSPVNQNFPIVSDSHIAIPTLSEWALIALAMMLAAFAAMRLRA